MMTLHPWSLGATRATRLRQWMEREQLDAVVCARPRNVLFLSGYWPVVGTSVLILLQDGRTVLIVPEDELDLAERPARADSTRIIVFSPASLADLRTTISALEDPLCAALGHLSARSARIGVERDGAFEPASYVSVFHFGAALASLIERLFERAETASIDQRLEELEAIRSQSELDRLGIAVAIAQQGFAEGRRHLEAGASELAAAAWFRAPLSRWRPPHADSVRADGIVFCMSGPNAGKAFGSHGRSTSRTIQHGELVLVHMNSTVDGYWTDLTRTYCLGHADEMHRRMYRALFEARAAALEAIRPGAPARDIDARARSVLTRHGFGEAFRHSTGHGVGLSAIDHGARPRLHPRSPDILETGMVFNVEPGIYFPGQCGMRHSDMVRVREDGAELLTPFQVDLAELELP